MTPREQFEAWAIADAASTDKTLDFERGGDWYLGKDHQVMNLGWAAWQASREALVIEWPEKQCPAAEDSGSWHNVRNSTIDACRRHIEAAGLKVMP